MKAQEYFLTYKDKFLDAKDQQELDKVVVTLLNDFNRDMKETIQKRRVSTDDAVVGTILEFNRKWNALARMFERHFKYSPIKIDGYLNFWRAKMPPQFKYAIKRRLGNA